MTLNERIAAEALALVGVRFRLHGRSEATGLDCVGLAALAVERAGGRAAPLPAYRLRGMGPIRAGQAIADLGWTPVAAACPGDLLLADSGPMQLHVMILTQTGLVHAHAGLGRVVLMPLPSPWPILGNWRLTNSHDGG